VYERAEHNGVRYFVTGGGGAPLYPKRPRSHPIDLDAVQRFERAFHYLRVAVTGRRVEVTGLRLDGTAIETTAWTDASTGRAPVRAAPPSPPRPGPPLPVEAGAPRPPAVASAAPPVPGDGPPFLWIGLAAVGGLLAAAVVVVRTLRR
jgi:hypothetical protein